MAEWLDLHFIVLFSSKHLHTLRLHSKQATTSCCQITGSTFKSCKNKYINLWKIFCYESIPLLYSISIKLFINKHLLHLGDTEEFFHLQAFDLCPLVLQLGLHLTDLSLLTTHKRLFHHGVFLELQLALEWVELEEGHTCMHTHEPVDYLRCSAPPSWPLLYHLLLREDSETSKQAAVFIKTKLLFTFSPCLWTLNPAWYM